MGVNIGQVWQISGQGYGPLAAAGPVRVMAVAEKYAMVRRKGCIPFVLSISDMNRFCSLISDSPRARGSEARTG